MTNLTKIAVIRHLIEVSLESDVPISMSAMTSDSTFAVLLLACRGRGEQILHLSAVRSGVSDALKRALWQRQCRASELNPAGVPMPMRPKFACIALLAKKRRGTNKDRD